MVDVQMDPEKSEKNQLEYAQNLPSVPEYDPAVHKSLLRKLDIRVVPAFLVLFLLAFLDRTNVGNAKVLGLQVDLGLSDNQYAIAVAIFSITYILVELPSNLVLKRISPQIWLPSIAFAWGIVTIGLGFVRNYHQLLIGRVFLGLAEGGLGPGIVLHLSTLYDRKELALRMGIIFAGASASGAFGGVLARGLYAIPTTSTVDYHWRWIFIIEGLISCIAAFICRLGIPNDIASAKFLTEEERAFGVSRLPKGSASFSWSEVKRGVTSIQLWLTGTAYFCILGCIQSFALFLPTIIVGLGTYTPVTANLLSTPPYIVASVMTVVIAFLSDRWHTRGPLVLAVLPVAIIGYAVISTTSNVDVKYAMTFLMAFGIYSGLPCMLVWLTGNAGSHYYRATVGGIQLMLANCSGFLAAFSYQSRQRPQYKESHTVMLGLLVYAWFAVLANCLYCRWINKQKESGKHDHLRHYSDDRNPDFKLTI